MSSEPRPRSPERLEMSSSVIADFDEERGVVRIHAEFTYLPWCCNGAHEVIDGLRAVHDVIDKSAHRAYRRRLQKIQQEIGELT